MPRPKLKSSIHSLILREYKKTPLLGVRAIAARIRQQHGIKVSKSALHAIVKQKGLTQPKGRKKARISYQVAGNRECGLVLLGCLDSQLGVLEEIIDQIKVYFPRLSREKLGQFILLATYASYAGAQLQNASSLEAFVRLAGLASVPKKSFDYFQTQLVRYRPAVNLQPVKVSLQPAATIKFYFKNGTQGYTDARFATFWDGPCRQEYFSSPLRGVLQRLALMVNEGVCMIGYTKSFGYLSLLTFRFVQGMLSGLEKVSVLDRDGKSLMTQGLAKPKMALVFGYSPRVINKGMVVLSRQRRLSRISQEGLSESYAACAQMKFEHFKVKEELFLHAVLLKEKTSGAFEWGVLSTFQAAASQQLALAKRYGCAWRSVNEDFFRDMEVLEKAYLSAAGAADIAKMIPSRLILASAQDFSRVGFILSVVFKELIGGWEPKAKAGFLRQGKDSVRIHLPQIPRQIAKRFNASRFSYGGKTAFIA